MGIPRSPAPTVDVIIEIGERAIVLVERRFEPHGWALPGGFIDEGERAEVTARREAREESGLEVELLELFNVYSDPRRDPRRHTLSVVYIGRASGEPRGGDDAARAAVFREDSLPSPLAFDHAQILAEYFRYRRTGERPAVPPC
jgi:8-oxo-dGTP diphosphatase